MGETDTSSAMRVSGLERAVVRLHQAVLVGLCLAAFLVPVVQVAVRGDNYGRLVGTRHLGSTLLFVSDPEVQRLIDDGAIDGSLDTTVTLARVGLLLVAVGLVAALFSLLAVDESDSSRSERTLRWVAVLGLATGAVLSTIALGMFPEDRLLIGPTWGLVLPLFAAGWLVVGRRVAHDFW